MDRSVAHPQPIGELLLIEAVVDLQRPEGIRKLGRQVHGEQACGSSISLVKYPLGREHTVRRPGNRGEW